MNNPSARCVIDKNNCGILALCNHTRTDESTAIVSGRVPTFASA